MLIGIMSDSHDDMESIIKAVLFFNSKKVEMVLHAGDLVAPFTFEEALGKLDAPFTGVFGNNDGDRLMLSKKSGERFFDAPYVMEAAGKRLVLMHEPRLVDELAESGKFDAIIYGHLHKHEIREKDGTLIISPGKLARLHKGESTVALLDTETMEASIIRL
ncbi:MAG: metallophosphoesterase [Nitrospiraceae bacterium]|nr:metallophosphoesterase [Nitrospiraceae bacterium]